MPTVCTLTHSACECVLIQFWLILVISFSAFVNFHKKKVKCLSCAPFYNGREYCLLQSYYSGHLVFCPSHCNMAAIIIMQKKKKDIQKSYLHGMRCFPNSALQIATKHTLFLPIPTIDKSYSWESSSSSPAAFFFFTLSVTDNRKQSNSDMHMQVRAYLYTLHS